MTNFTSDKLELEQIQQRIKDQIRRWYVHQLGHSGVEVTCHIFDNKLMIVLDNAVTQPERLLAASGRMDFAEQVRTALDGILRLHLQKTIETLTRLRIVDLLTTTQLKTERTSIVAILSEPITANNPHITTPMHQNERGTEYGDE